MNIKRYINFNNIKRLTLLADKVRIRPSLGPTIRQGIGPWGFADEWFETRKVSILAGVGVFTKNDNVSFSNFQIKNVSIATKKAVKVPISLVGSLRV